MKHSQRRGLETMNCTGGILILILTVTYMYMYMYILTHKSHILCWLRYVVAKYPVHTMQMHTLYFIDVVIGVLYIETDSQNRKAYLSHYFIVDHCLGKVQGSFCPMGHQRTASSPTPSKRTRARSTVATPDTPRGRGKRHSAATAPQPICCLDNMGILRKVDS